LLLNHTQRSGYRIFGARAPAVQIGKDLAQIGWERAMAPDDAPAGRMWEG
jgi:hypothetical protein